MNEQAQIPETGLMDEAVRRYRDEMDSKYLAAGKGTIKLRPGDAAHIPDAEFQDLIRAALLALRSGRQPSAHPAQNRIIGTRTRALASRSRCRS